LVNRAKELQMPAVAVTDLGNMFGAVDFYLAAKSAGVKPILGAEIFYTTGSRLVKPLSGKALKKVQVTAQDEENARLYRLVLLCKDATGYQNLCEIVTRGYTEGFWNRPRVDREILQKHSQGLIALSAGMRGEIGMHAAQNRTERAEEAFLGLREIYKDDFYLELLETGMPDQRR
jgi:DNA polymerase-3 subunit alpha